MSIDKDAAKTKKVKAEEEAQAEQEQQEQQQQQEQQEAKPKKKKVKKVAKKAAAEKPTKKKKADAEPVAQNEAKGNPFRAGSAIAKAFDMCVKGTTRNKLKKFCEDQEIGAARVFACMKAGEYGGTKYKYTEDDSGNITIKLLKKKEAA